MLAGLEAVETLLAAGVETRRGVTAGVLHRRGRCPIPTRHARQPRVRGRPAASRRRRHRRRRHGARVGDEL
ncbi:MAG: hypothetical protein R2697_16235 [Ilumatobacteraceae bacterium]